MLEGITHKRRLFWYFFPVFMLFAITITVFQYKREKEYRIAQLENTLNQISVITNNYIQQHTIIKNGSYFLIDSVKSIIDRPEIRITVIDYDGYVVYDSFVDDINSLENHKSRPEIQKSLYSEFGTDIRESASTGKEYYYYSISYTNYFVRTAIEYDVSVRNFLKAEKLFLFFIVVMFFVILGILSFVANRIGKSVTRLKDISIKAGRNELLDENIKFPKSELGIISSQIIKIYNKLKLTGDELTKERDKLINHLYVLKEGVAIFTNEKKKTLSNNLFVHYMSMISDKPTITIENIFDMPEFKLINEFIDKNLKMPFSDVEKENPKTEITVHKNNSYFKIQCIIFNDKSFEIIIDDITDLEKRRIVKQQMTSNISHELKTPVSSIIAYLETLINNNTDEERRQHFTEKAYKQAKRLSELLADISVLSKIEEAGDLFEVEVVDVGHIINDVKENLRVKLEDAKIKLEVNVDQTKISGSKNLLFSIFQNLLENSINYAGENISIEIKRYLEDNDYYYFSYSDNGAGIPEEHLTRIFERFYRIDTGRSRKLGGTGLGLSIVKNAVIHHGGNISVKNKADGGIEFLFSLAKNLNN